MDQVTFRLTGTAPMLHHSSVLVDPMSEATRWLAAATSKRSKTIDDHVEVAWREWCGGLYSDTEGRVVLPGDNIYRALQEAGSRRKKQSTIKRAVFPAAPDYLLEYDGPKGDKRKLYDDGRFTSRMAIAVNRVRVMRTRPIFRAWSAVVDFVVDTTEIDVDTVVAVMADAGRYIGVGDYRPRYGRFTAEVI